MKQLKKGKKQKQQQSIQYDKEEEIVQESQQINSQEVQEESSSISIIQNPQQDVSPSQRVEDYKEKQNNRGVCYISRIPPYMKPNYIKKLLDSFMVERVYLLPESDWVRRNRIKRGGNKKICFREGWVEFTDKRMAKLAALTLNGQKMVGKKGNFYSEDLWNLKYLPKFKWHNLTQRLAHQERLKRQRLKVELEMQKKVEDFYSQKLAKSKMIKGIQSRKLKKGKQLKQQKKQQRQFNQIKMAPQIEEQ